MNITFIFAILTGISAASYSIFQKYASTKISAPLGAMIASLVALTINFVILTVMKFRNQSISFSKTGLIYVFLLGLAAACIDLFGLLTYSKGFKLTSSFIINGIHAAIILVIGYLILKEPLNLGKLIGIILIIAGVIFIEKYGV